MKILKIVAGVLVVLGLTLAFVAPVGPVPGFFIGGEKTAVPERWADTSDIHEIKLKVPGLLPRVVTIWVVEFNQELHVVGAIDSGWVEMLGQGGPVEMRLEGKTYALNASRISADREAILAAYIDKYKADYPEIIEGFPSYEEGSEQFAVFRLGRS